MIFFYKHKTLDELTENEINFLGYDGVKQYALKNGINPDELYAQIMNLENKMKFMQTKPEIANSPAFSSQLEKSIEQYISFFNNGATHEKQAYFVIGNISSGKSTYSKTLEKEKSAIIADPDRIKMGEMTRQGFYEGISSFYNPNVKDSLQIEGRNAINAVIEELVSKKFNLVLPTSPTTFEKLEAKAKKLHEKGYDIHLILMDTPLCECANRNYLRFLEKEFSQATDPNGNPIRGRFVQQSVLIDRADSCYSTFVNARNSKRYKSYRAFYNDNKNSGEEIDIESMQPLQ